MSAADDAERKRVINMRDLAYRGGYLSELLRRTVDVIDQAERMGRKRSNILLAAHAESVRKVLETIRKADAL